MAEQAEITKHPGGRTRLSFNLRQVEELGRIQSTLPELAAVLGVSVDTVERSNRERHPEICLAMRPFSA